MRTPSFAKTFATATTVVSAKRAKVVAEMPDWQQLRDAGSAIRQHALDHLDEYLLQFEAACTAAGGHVHWAVDGADANRIAVEIACQASGEGSHQDQVDDHRGDRSQPRA